MKLRIPRFGGTGHGIPIIGQRKRESVVFGSPFGSSVMGIFHKCTVRAIVYEGTKSAEDRILADWAPQEGFFIAHNRNALVQRFLEKSTADWLLQIDSDIEFPPTIIESMLALTGPDRKVMAASVPLGWDGARDAPLPSCALRYGSEPGHWVYLQGHEITPEGVDVDGLAAPVLIAHRSVFEAIADKFGQNWFLTAPPVPKLNIESSRIAWASEDGRIADRQFIPQGEDLSFCLRAAEVGFKLWCARVPGLRHHKTVPLSHDFEAEPMPQEVAG